MAVIWLEQSPGPESTTGTCTTQPAASTLDREVGITRCSWKEPQLVLCYVVLNST